MKSQPDDGKLGGFKRVGARVIQVITAYKDTPSSLRTKKEIETVRGNKKGLPMTLLL